MSFVINKALERTNSKLEKFNAALDTAKTEREEMKSTARTSPKKENTPYSVPLAKTNTDLKKRLEAKITELDQFICPSITFLILLQGMCFGVVLPIVCMIVGFTILGEFMFSASNNFKPRTPQDNPDFLNMRGCGMVFGYFAGGYLWLVLFYCSINYILALALLGFLSGCVLYGVNEYLKNEKRKVEEILLKEREMENKTL